MKKKSVHRVRGEFLNLNLLFFLPPVPPLCLPGVAPPSEHAKTFGVGDGFQQSFPQLLFAAVLGQQQHVKASV